ncbi:MAG: AAA family ATPase [Bryobacterales bacterium]|nr:AAA family ATPase [Bryobacterales bacterium]
MRNVIGPVARGDNFFGRTRELAECWRVLETGSVLLSGPRRIGKTSFLHRLLDDANRNGFGQWTYVDLSDAKTEADFFTRLGESFSSSRRLIVIDEFDHFVWRLQDPNARERLLTSMRRARLESSGVAWVISAEARLRDPFLQSTLSDLYEIQLGPFDPFTALNFLLDLSTTYGMEISLEAINHALRRVTLAPHDLQLLFSGLREFETGIGIAEVDQVIDGLSVRRVRWVGQPAPRLTLSAGKWRIRHLELQNFRCFENLQIDLTGESSLEGDWTCVAGINGAGKSTVLQSIAIGLLSEDAKELGGGLLARMIRRDASHSQDAQGSQIIVSLVEAESGWREETSVSIEANGALRTLPITLPNSTVLVGYGATRNIGGQPDMQLENLSPHVRRVAGLFFPLSQPAAADILISSRRRNKAVVPLFRNTLQAIFGPELVFIEAEDSMRFEVMGKDRVDAADLPDGFRSSVAWIADLCATWCDVNPEAASTAEPKDIQAIVLIDEVDLHLHPSLQRQLVPRLRKALPNIQWIVTTHSPLILSSFDSAEIIALDRDEPTGVRFLDRQIMGFSPNDIYGWLMGTPVSSVAMEEKLRNAGADPGKQREAAELLEASPFKNGAEAKAGVADLLKRLERQAR